MAEFDKLNLGWVAPEERSYSVAKSHDHLMQSSRVFGAAAANIRDTGKGKIALIYQPLIELLGRFPTHTQKIGSCVSHGFGLGVDVLKAVEIKLRGENEEFKAETATEWIYGTSRVIQGGGRLGNQDGSLGSWASRAVMENGTLGRLDYGGGKLDLRKLDEDKAKDWGYRGLPFDMEVIADEHPVQTTALVTSYEEARDAIANGYPVPVCSMQGFQEKRDVDGFAKAQGQWAHCMLFMASDDEFRRPGLLCMNSWGEHWISGPRRHNQPEGSFWVDADVADKMLRQNDSYALSNFLGYENQVQKILDVTSWNF